MIWNGISTVIQSVWNFITQYLQAIWTAILYFATPIFESIKNFISECWDKIKFTTSLVWEAIKNFLISCWNGLVAFVVPILNKLSLGSLRRGIKSAQQQKCMECSEKLLTIMLERASCFCSTNFQFDKRLDYKYMGQNQFYNKRDME